MYEDNFNKNKKFHFIGVGGVGMSGLAKVLLESGFKVSGSDVKSSKYTEQLEKLGGKIFIGQKAENVEPNTIIVASTAIKASNPEMQKANELGLEVMHRSDVLAFLSEVAKKEYNQITIGASGTHGKTTVSGLCSYILEKIAEEPSYVVGGIIPEINTNAKFGKGRFFVAELDESDGTIVKYSPKVNIIMNLEEDHLDFYTRGFEQLIETFQKYVSNFDDDAKIVINIDNEGNITLLDSISFNNIITYGLEEALNPQYLAKNVKLNGFENSADIYKNGELLGEIKLSVPGIHNISNALGVVAALVESGIEFEKIQKVITGFTGMGRRFQLVGKVKNSTIIDDYAHHPTEITATLKSAKSVAQNNRIVAIFQPHRPSRLKGLWDEFLAAFDDVDVLFVTDVYSAGEDSIENYTAETFAREIKHPCAKYVSGNMEEIAKKILPEIKENDIILTLGAGDITKVGGLLESEEKKLFI